VGYDADAIAVATLTLLVTRSARMPPPGTEFALSSVRIALVGAGEIKRRRTVGPLLVLVEGGTIAVSVNARAQRLGPGESVLVEMDRLFTLRTAGPEPAHALLLGLVPPERQLPIGPHGTPAIWIPAPEEAKIVSPRQLFFGEVGPLAREETVLFAACLHWMDVAAKVAAASYPGPVRVLVLQGELIVDQTDRIGAGGCSLDPAFAPVQLAAGDEPPVVSFVGALKASAPAVASPGEAAVGATADSRGSTCLVPESVGGD
jgi:hypothetical protein